MGRKARLTQEECEVIIAKSPNCSAFNLAKEFSVSVPTIYNVVRKKPPYNFNPPSVPMEDAMRVAIP